MERKFRFIKNIKDITTKMNLEKVKIIVDILATILGTIGVLYIYKKATNKYYNACIRKEYGDEEFE